MNAFGYSGRTEGVDAHSTSDYTLYIAKKNKINIEHCRLHELLKHWKQTVLAICLYRPSSTATSSTSFSGPAPATPSSSPISMAPVTPTSFSPPAGRQSPPFHFPRHGASHLFFSQHSSSSFFLLLWHCRLVDYLRPVSCIISWHVYMSCDP